MFLFVIIRAIRGVFFLAFLRDPAPLGLRGRSFLLDSSTPSPKNGSVAQNDYFLVGHDFQFFMFFFVFIPATKTAGPEGTPLVRACYSWMVSLHGSMFFLFRDDTDRRMDTDSKQ